MNRYAFEDAVHRIYGYFLPRPEEDDGNRITFDRAKDECLQHMRRAVVDVESITFKDFAKARKE